MTGWFCWSSFASIPSRQQDQFDIRTITSDVSELMQCLQWWVRSSRKHLAVFYREEGPFFFSWVTAQERSLSCPQLTLCTVVGSLFFTFHSLPLDWCGETLWRQWQLHSLFGRFFQTRHEIAPSDSWFTLFYIPASAFFHSFCGLHVCTVYLLMSSCSFSCSFPHCG